MQLIEKQRDYRDYVPYILPEVLADDLLGDEEPETVIVEPEAVAEGSSEILTTEEPAFDQLLIDEEEAAVSEVAEDLESPAEPPAVLDEVPPPTDEATPTVESAPAENASQENRPGKKRRRSRKRSRKRGGSKDGAGGGD